MVGEPLLEEIARCLKTYKELCIKVQTPAACPHTTVDRAGDDAEWMIERPNTDGLAAEEGSLVISR